VEKHALYVACGLSPRRKPGGSGSEGTWLRLEELQPANRKRMSAADFLNGFHIQSGDRFG
jgi:hypothetical protein